MAIRMSSEPGINAFRFVLMFTVVLAHSWSFSGGIDRGPSMYLVITAQCAVPAFFITSGYFMRWREGDALAVTRWACGKLLPLYVIWVTIYVMAAWLADMGSLADLVASGLRGGPARHLWFLLGLAFALSATSLSLRLVGPQLTWIAAITLAAAGLLNGTYQMWFGLDSHPVRSGLLTAPLLVLLGTWVATAELPRRPLLFGLTALLAYILQIYDDKLIASFAGYSSYNRWAITLATIPFALAVFLFARSLPHARIVKWIAERKHYLLVIYCIHPMIIIAMRWTWQLQGLASVLIVSTFAYALSLMAAMLLSAANRRWGTPARSPRKRPSAAETAGSTAI